MSEKIIVYRKSFNEIFTYPKPCNITLILKECEFTNILYYPT